MDKFPNVLNKLVKISLVFFFVLIVISNLKVTSNNHYYLLAQSFLQGKLYFVELPGVLWDTVEYGGHYYWPNPPFPAVLMMPFVWIFGLFSQVYYQGYLNLVVVGLLFLVLKRIFKDKGAKEDVAFWAYAFLVCTPFLGMAMLPWSWFLAHTITVFLIFLSYLLYKRGVPLSVIGLIFGLIALTRFTGAIGLMFFVLSVISKNWLDKKDPKRMAKELFALLWPFILCLLLMFAYNYARYDTWKELGYIQNKLWPWHQEARNMGVFSLRHLPGNLYYLFLKSPDPVFIEGSLSHVLASPYIKASTWGMGIFFTSPFLLLLFTYTYKKRESLLLLLTSLLISIPILLYFGVGWVQFGYKYSLDFLPFIYILFVSEYTAKNNKLSDRMKILMLVVSFTNLYFIINMFSG
ncbi:hypothetical protein C4561_03515 [candidate division WWE3 bacterium]|jgi:hypothetical protein|uniref:Glycosyltransferase RgtA/B/C/D-like domain-containing protein n=1 Tax=candidate division WWE3 bacterium TaxID=2053526 RepID=A0A3A4ZCD6_UNCKA|nr:MAG: hypothetical protein C4561_03515 [candidate division WWE3 bacterium]